MAFNGSGAASGATTGATMGSAFGPWGTVIGGVVGGVAGAFSKNKKKTVELDPYAGMTPEQKQAMATLSQFGNTGQIGDFQAGDAADMSGFNYSMTPQELAGQEMLDYNNASGPATGITDSQNALTGMVNSTFNPDDPSNGFAAFQRQLARSTKDQADVMARNAAITGNRFGTQIGKDYVNLQAQQSDLAASKLAELWQQTQQNKISAASGLNSLANSQENINQSRIQQAYTLGARQRDLQNQQAQAQYDDWVRARNERMTSINSLATVLSKGTTPGIMKYDYTQPGAFQQFTDSYNKSGGGSGGMGSISSLLSMINSNNSANGAGSGGGIGSSSSLGYTSYTGR